MFGKRAKWGWLALLAVWLYTLAPVLAMTAPRAVPLACAAQALHTCSCRAGLHAPGSCCCAHDGAGKCSLGKAPCDGGATAPDGALWTTAHPLAFPTAPHPLIRVIGPTSPLLSGAAPLRPAAPRLHTPPPQQTA